MSRLGLVTRFSSLLLLLVLCAHPVSAQDRPSLERIEAVMCAQADEQGQQYRPIFCDPRCDCAPDPGVAVSTVATTCEQQTSDLVRIERTIEPHDVQCVGFCSGLPFPVPCTESSPGCNCDSSSFTCLDRAIYGAGLPICFMSSECDQANGFTCTSQGAGGFCEKASYSCSTLGEVCATGVAAPAEEFEFEFAPNGSLTPLSCSTGGNINSTDANACLAFAEATLGAGACVICGDGNLDPGEQCDDGNTTPGDGCAPDCTTE